MNRVYPLQSKPGKWLTVRCRIMAHRRRCAMRWLETDVIKERTRFVLDYESGLFTMSELCERFGISRQTGYALWERYQEQGLPGLQDRARGPKSCPHKTLPQVEQAPVSLRRAHPNWGPVTLLQRLAMLYPQLPLPAAST